jgi:hypothetical protein
MRKLLLFVIAVVVCACAEVRPWQRGLLASPALQFEHDPYAAGQETSIWEIIEGASFKTGGPGSAGAGCGCH